MDENKISMETDNNLEEDRITLEFDDGAVIECEILGLFDVKGIDYIALADLNSDEVYLYRYAAGKDDSDFELIDIPDDEFPMVSKEFDALTEQLDG